jgi:hypothetical protein
MVWRGDSNPLALRMGGDTSQSSALILVRGGAVNPVLHSNATPHQTPKCLLSERFINTSASVSTVAMLTTPPNETATDAAMVAFTPKTTTEY